MGLRWLSPAVAGRQGATSSLLGQWHPLNSYSKDLLLFNNNHIISGGISEMAT